MVHTRSGWLDGLEVVEVTFDPTIVTYDSILKAAVEKDCATRVWAHNDTQFEKAKAAVGDRARTLNERAKDAKPADQLFALGRAPHQYLPLTPMQATKVNADLRQRRKPERWLSPRQKQLLQRIITALDHDANALATLSRPSDINKLGDYHTRLVAMLNRIDDLRATKNDAQE